MDILKLFIDSLKDKEEVRFIYLSGEILEKEMECQDIDIHLGLSSQIENSTLLDIAEKYYGILHEYEKENIFTIVYDNGEIIKFHKENCQNFKTPPVYCKLIDKDNILEQAECFSDSLSDIEIANIVNDYSMNMLEFTKRYSDKDVLYLMDLINQMQKQVTLVLSYKSNDNLKDDNILGKLKTIDKKYAIEIAKIIKDYKYNTILQTCQLLAVLMNEAIVGLNFMIGQNINYDLFNYAKKGLFSL